MGGNLGSTGCGEEVMFVSLLTSCDMNGSNKAPLWQAAALAAAATAAPLSCWIPQQRRFRKYWFSSV